MKLLVVPGYNPFTIVYYDIEFPIHQE